MAGLTGVFSLLCVVGGHLSGAAPAVQSLLPGANMSLTCNLTCAGDILWFQLRSDQLLHLLTISWNKLSEPEIEKKHSRIRCRVQSERDPVVLELMQVEEEDAGVYFCVGKSSTTTCVDRGVQLLVQGDESASARDGKWQPCFSLGICVLLASLLICVLCVFGLYLCSGRPAVCCCGTKPDGGSQKVTEDDSVLYSSLKHFGRQPPSHGRGGDDNVTYSTVANHKSWDKSHDHRMKGVRSHR